MKQPSAIPDHIDIPSEPTFVFPNDDFVTPEQYQGAMSNLYVVAGSPLLEPIMDKFDLDLPDESYERSKRVLSASHWLDHFIDESEDRSEARQFYFDGINTFMGNGGGFSAPSGMREELLTSMVLLMNATNGMDREEVRSMADSAIRIGQIAEEKEQATTIGKYVELLREEARETASMFNAAVFSGSAGSSQRQRFTGWVSTMMEMSVFADSTFDLAEDRESGLTGVEPTTGNKIRLASEAALRLPRAIGGIGIKNIAEVVRLSRNPNPVIR